MVQGSSTLQMVHKERRGRGESGKRGERGEVQGLGADPVHSRDLTSGGPCFAAGIGKGRQTCSTIPLPRVTLAGLHSPSWCDPPIAPSACWLLSVPSSTSLLSLAPPLPCPFSPSSLAEFLLSPPLLLFVCLISTSLPLPPLHQGSLCHHHPHTIFLLLILSLRPSLSLVLFLT